MVSIGIHSGRNLLSYPSFSPINKSNQFFSSNPFLSISNKTKKIQKKSVSSSITSTNPTLVSARDSHTKDGIFPEKIDSWLQESVSEIVKNLKKAPFLVQIYSENEKGGKVMKIQTEKANFEKWPVMKGEWVSGDSKSPDGLIFVEELLGQVCDNEENVDQDSGEGVSRAWGIVIQGKGKGVECVPACYLLKTNRVCGGMGLGFCTYFCLMRVSNLRDGVFQQFKDFWLVQ